MMHSFQNDGYAILHPILTSSMCEQISSSLTQMSKKGIGSRSLLEMPWCTELAQTIRRHPAIAPFLPVDAVAVQCTFFEKSRDQNWLVPIHQDLSIPVKEKLVNPALTGWSEKQGSVFVQPPDWVLQELVAVRLHVDECGNDDGALRIVPGSHRLGRLSNEDALKARSNLGEVVCAVAKGGALLLKPLVLHASSKATGQSRRRVLHLVFGPIALPLGLRWQHAV
ncbi:MAG: phytanoyl-CoA dioxygenase family protein [Pseudomonadota bacterium]